MCILCVAVLMDLFVLCVCELYGEPIRNMFGCGCWFVVECYGTALLMVFLCVIVHTMWSGKSLQLPCILPFGMLCLSAISVNCVQSAFLTMIMTKFILKFKTSLRHIRDTSMYKDNNNSRKK